VRIARGGHRHHHTSGNVYNRPPMSEHPPHRPRGRPRLDPEARLVRLSVSVTEQQYDRVFRIAQREGVTMPEVIRQVLRAAEKKTDH